MSASWLITTICIKANADPLPELIGGIERPFATRHSRDSSFDSMRHCGLVSVRVGVAVVAEQRQHRSGRWTADRQPLMK